MAANPDVAVVAAAERLKASDKKRLQAFRRRQEDWQDEAWTYNDEVPEVNFGMRFKGNLLSRVRLYAAWRPDPSGPAVPVNPDELPDDENDALRATFEQANIELARIEGPGGRQSELLRRIGINLEVAGEGFVYGRTITGDVPEAIDVDVGEERWDVLSSSEVFATDREYRRKLNPADRQGVPVDGDNEFFLRVWRPHPEWFLRPDAPMRAILPLCEELLIVSRLIRSSALSRTWAGILGIPSETTFVRRSARQGTEADGQARDDPFLDAIAQSLESAIRDPESPDAYAPVIIKAPKEALEALRKVTLADRDVDENLRALRGELIERIAKALDLPTEILTGLADASHWTAWLIDEQTFKAHLEPLLITLCDSLTSGFLQPALQAQGVLSPDRVFVWYDESNLVGHPDQFSNAVQMHDRFAISDAYLRRTGGASEDDAPDDNEVERRLELERSKRTSSTTTTEAAGDGPPGDAPGPEERDAPELDMPDEPPALVAAAEPLERLGVEQASLDRALRLRVQTAADAAVGAMLDRAGASLRRRVNGDVQLRTSRNLAQTRNRDLPRALGRTLVVDQWGLREEELIRAELDDLEAQYRDWTQRTYVQTLELGGRIARQEEQLARMLEDTEAERDDAIGVGWAFLAAALTGAAATQLFPAEAPTPEEAAGEFDPSVRVQAGTIRESLARAGGASQVAPSGVEAVVARPSGGVATGDLVLSTFERSLDLVAAGWQWVYGDPGTRGAPFPPHLSLDGARFATWNDETLTNTQASWLPVSHFYPGDHLGCQCDFVPTYREA